MFRHITTGKRASWEAEHGQDGRFDREEDTRSQKAAEAEPGEAGGAFRLPRIVYWTA